ncbi:hypothetical protein ACHAWF_000382 [Thalassiosira exigua]
MCFEQKVEIAAAYLKEQDAAGGIRPNISKLSKQLRVARGTVRKVEKELIGHVYALDPKTLVANHDIPSGPGSISLSDVDVLTILLLYHQEPNRSLRSYCYGLWSITGSIVDESTISRFFNHGFEIKGSLCKPNLIRYDKLRPENLNRAIEYILIISWFHCERLKFGDKKHLKGAEVYCHKTRKNFSLVVCHQS